MADVIDRIQKLIALAVGTSSSEEGRTAAMAAVKLIHEHNVKLIPHAANRFYQPPPPRHPGVTNIDPFLQELQEIVFGAQRRREHVRSATPSGVRGVPVHEFIVDDLLDDEEEKVTGEEKPPRPPMRKRSEANRSPRRHSTGAVSVTIGSVMRCEDCGSRIDRGERAWAKNHGAVHEFCDPRKLG